MSLKSSDGDSSVSDLDKGDSGVLNRDSQEQETSLWNQERLQVVFPKRLGSSSAGQGRRSGGRSSGGVSAVAAD